MLVRVRNGSSTRLFVSVVVGGVLLHAGMAVAAAEQTDAHTLAQIRQDGVIVAVYGIRVRQGSFPLFNSKGEVTTPVAQHYWIGRPGVTYHFLLAPDAEPCTFSLLVGVRGDLSTDGGGKIRHGLEVDPTGKIDPEKGIVEVSAPDPSADGIAPEAAQRVPRKVVKTEAGSDVLVRTEQGDEVVITRLKPPSKGEYSCARTRFGNWRGATAPPTSPP